MDYDTKGPRTETCRRPPSWLHGFWSFCVFCICSRFAWLASVWGNLTFPCSLDVSLDVLHLLWLLNVLFVFFVVISNFVTHYVSEDIQTHISLRTFCPFLWSFCVNLWSFYVSEDTLSLFVDVLYLFEDISFCVSLRSFIVSEDTTLECFVSLETFYVSEDTICF